MSRENEKQKSGNAFINALKKSNMTAMAAILVVMIIIASIVSPYFLNVYNLQSVLRDLAFVGMIGIAQSLLLLVGELDLSVGKIACLSGILTGMLMVNVGLNPWLCLVIGLILCRCRNYNRCNIWWTCILFLRPFAGTDKSTKGYRFYIF